MRADIKGMHIILAFYVNGLPYLESFPLEVDIATVEAFCAYLGASHYETILKY